MRAGGLLLLVLVCAPLLASASSVTCFGGSCTFATIRTVANAVNDTLIVTGGPYRGSCTPIIKTAVKGVSHLLANGTVVIDCQGSGSVLNATGAGNITVTGFTILNAVSTSSVYGGVMDVIRTNLTLNNVTFQSCKAPLMFIGNLPSTLAVGRSLQMFNCTFISNTANSAPPLIYGLCDDFNGGGGAVVSYAAITRVYNSVFIGNNASKWDKSDGGGLWVARGSYVEVRGNRFIRNTARQDGGGLFVVWCDLAVLTSNVFSNNSATSSTGGGFYAQNTAMIVTYCQFDSNSAAFGGSHATIESVPSASIIQYCNFTNGKSGFAANGGPLVITDCLFTGNSNGALQISEGVLATRCNITDNSASFYYPVITVYRGNMTNCVVARNRANAVDTVVIQAGREAYVASTLFTNNTGTVVRYNDYYPLTTTFQSVVFAGNYVPPASYGSFDGVIYVDMSGGAIALLSNVTMYQNTVAGTGTITVRDGNCVVLNSNVYNNTASNGGGVALISYCYSNDHFLKIKDSRIYNNTATQNGGGILINGYNFTMEGSWVTGNVAVAGGGMYIAPLLGNDVAPPNLLNNSFAYINGSTIAGNSAQDGAGVYVVRSPRTVIQASVITGNTASRYGGGLVSDSQGTAFPHTLFLLSNTSVITNTGQGGAMAFIGGTATFLNSYIAGNTGYPTAINCVSRPAFPVQTTNTPIAHHRYPAVLACPTGGPANFGACGVCDYGSCNLTMGGCMCFTDITTYGPCCSSTNNCAGGICTYYVDSALGQDTNTGSDFANAFRTVSWALGWALPNDIIYLRGSFAPVTINKPISFIGPATFSCGGGGVIVRTLSRSPVNWKHLVFARCFADIDSSNLTCVNCTFVTQSTVSVENATVTISGARFDNSIGVMAQASALDASARSSVTLSDAVVTAQQGTTTFSVRDPGTVFTARNVTCSGVTGNSGGAIAVTNGATAALAYWQVYNAVASANGGAFYVSSATLTVNDSVIRGASAQYGAGLYVGNAAVATLQRTMIIGASVSATQGAGVYCTGSTLTLDAAQLHGNTGANQGAGVYATTNCRATVRDSVINGSTANVAGGGWFSTGSSVVMQRTTIMGCAASNGGGVNAVGDTFFLMEDSVVADNHGSEGGGMYAGGNITIINTSFSGNSASTFGGALRVTQGVPLSVSGSQFIANTAASDGAALVSDIAIEFDNNNVSYNVVPSGCKGLTTPGGSALVLNAGSSIRGLTALYNQGGLGAAIKTTDTTTMGMFVYDSHFEGNACGSAVFVKATAPAQISGTTFAGNTGWGGAVYLAQGSTTQIGNCVVRGNVQAIGLDQSPAAAGITCISCTLTLTGSTISGNTVSSSPTQIGAGFGCHDDSASRYSSALTFSGTAFYGNVDPTYPNLEADFSDCGGCDMRGYVHAPVQLTATMGQGCVPLRDGLCNYTCASPYLCVAENITCDATATVVPSLPCQSATQCVPLVPGPGVQVTQDTPPVNNSIATFSCTTSTDIISDSMPRVCHPPAYVPSTVPTCSPPATTATTAGPSGTASGAGSATGASSAAGSTTSATADALNTGAAPGSSGGVDTGPIIAAIIGVAIVLAALIIGIVLWQRRRRPRRAQQPANSDDTVKADGLSMQLLLDDMLANATVIAEGGSATVYKARYEGNVVALKLFKQSTPAAVLDYHREVKTFTVFNEAEATGAVLGLKFISASPMAIAMDYVDGPSLHDIIKRDGRNMSENKRMEILEQIVDILELFEDRHLAHLDVKTRNILIEKGNTVKLIDYGLTQVTTDSHPVDELTGFTPQYVAPEIAAIAHNLNRNASSSLNTASSNLATTVHPVVDLHAADVFSLGTVVWSLCALDEPYRGMSGAEVYAAIINDPKKRPPLPEHAHGHWLDIIGMCWREDAKERPTFAELAVTVHRCRESCFDSGVTRRHRPVSAVPRTRAEILKITPPCSSARGADYDDGSTMHVSVGPSMQSSVDGAPSTSAQSGVPSVNPVFARNV